MFFGEFVDPVFFGDLLGAVPLAGAVLHGLELGEGGLAGGAVGGVVFFDELFHLVGPLEHDAAAGGFAAHFAEVGKVFALHKDVADVAVVVDIFLGELDYRARLDGAPRADVMADAGGGGAQRLAVVHIIGVDERERFFAAHVDDELAYLDLLLGREAKLLAGLGAYGAVGVIPRVHHAEVDEFVEPLFAQQVVEVVLAKAGGHAGEQFVFHAVQNALHALAVNIRLAAALVADQLGALDGNERGDIAHRAHFFRHLIGDELAVGENLKVAILMLRQNIEQPFVHKRLAAEDAEETIARLASLADEPVQLLRLNLLLLCRDIHPTALAAEVAGIEHRNI